MSANLIRAERAGACLRLHRKLTGDGDPATSVTDLVADIGHFCVENDLTYLYLLSRGISHWRLEMTDPEGVEPLTEVTIHINESTCNA